MTPLSSEIDFPKELSLANKKNNVIKNKNKILRNF